MKRIFIVFMVLVASVAFAQTDTMAEKTKPSLSFMRQVQYFKLMADEEKKILDQYVRCLDTVDTMKGLQVCQNKKNELMVRLRKSTTAAHNAPTTKPGAPKSSKPMPKNHPPVEE